MKTIILFALALVLATGCAAEVGPAPAPPVEQIYHAYTACTQVTDSAPNADCSAGQLSVTRCTNATENPDTDHCTGPRTNQAQALGNVWCCN